MGSCAIWFWNAALGSGDAPLRSGGAPLRSFRASLRSFLRPFDREKLPLVLARDSWFGRRSRSIFSCVPSIGRSSPWFWRPTLGSGNAPLRSFRASLRSGGAPLDSGPRLLVLEMLPFGVVARPFDLFVRPFDREKLPLVLARDFWFWSRSPSSWSRSPSMGSSATPFWRAAKPSARRRFDARAIARFLPGGTASKGDARRPSAALPDVDRGARQAHGCLEQESPRVRVEPPGERRRPTGGNLRPLPAPPRAFDSARSSLALSAAEAAPVRPPLRARRGRPQRRHLRPRRPT
jgi:hypothetical protein